MPVYQYKGIHYELPDGLSNDQALLKIKTHLGETTEEPKKSDNSGFNLFTTDKETIQKRMEPIAGVGEAALSFLTSIPAMTYGVPAGMAEAKRRGYKFGTPEFAQKADELAGESMAANTYEPRSETGKMLNDKLSEFINEIGIPAAGVIHTMPPIRTAPSVRSQIPKVMEEVQPKVSMESLKPTVEEPSLAKGMEAQLELGKQMELRDQKLADKVIQPDLFAEDQLARGLSKEESGIPDVETKNAQDPFGRPGRMVVDENGIPIDVQKSMDVQRELQTERMDNGDFMQNRDLFEEAKPDQWKGQEDFAVAEEAMRRSQEMEKQRQMDQMFNERQSTLEQQKIQDALDEQNDHLTSIEEELRASTYKPQDEGQGPKTRAFNRGVGKRQSGGADIEGFFDLFKNNASGESKASMEAVNRLAREKLLGQERMVIQPNGEMRPIVGVDSVDYRARNGEVVIQRGIGKNEWTILESNGVKNPQALLNRALSKQSSFNAGMAGRQKGGLLISPKGDKSIASLDKQSEAVKAADEQLGKEKRQAIVAQVLGDKSLLDSYKDNIDTPEKVIAIAPEAKDISKSQELKARSVSPGINSVVASSNNPLLKYVRSSTSKVFRTMENLSRQYVTGKDGFGTKYKKLSKDEKADLWAALQYADKHQIELTPESMRKAGLNEKQIDLAMQMRKMDDLKYNLFNDARKTVGLPEVDYRTGHMAYDFTGDYRTLVYDKDNKIIGYIGTRTAMGNKMVQEKVVKQFPGAKFSRTERKSLGGTGQRSNFFVGLQDILTVLSKNDPRLAKIQEIAREVGAEQTDALFGASQHAKDKKGIFGSEGNKFWQDRYQNAEEGFKSFIQYWESGILSHLNLPVEVSIKELMDNPSLDHMPNTKTYVNDYVRNMTGRSLGTTADVLNGLIDTPARLLGVGSSVPREVITQFNKRASQFTMGFINPLFMITQYLQVPQMAFPQLTKFGRLTPDVVGKPVVDALKMAMEHITDKKMDIDPLTRDAYKYAQENGLMNFSEFGQTQHVFQNKFSRGFDKSADFLRETAEKSTRPYVFFTAVELLKKQISDQKTLFDTAYNITQEAMVDYSKRERPLVYGRLGALGQTAGSLQTFKHAFLGQLSTFISDAKKGKPVPLMMAMLTVLAYSGIKGIPFYQEADQLYQEITTKFFHDRKAIADSVMKNYPEWLKSGALSTETGINMQSRVSTADVIPNTPVEAISPFTAWATKIGKAAGEVASNPWSSNKWGELAVAASPSGTIKGMVETGLRTNDKGETLNRQGQVNYPRTEKDTLVRKYTGGTTLDESLQKEKLWNQMQNQKDRLDAKKKLTQKAELMLAENRVMVNGQMTPEFKDLVEEYKKEKGDPQQLVNSLIEYAKTKNLTQKQRLEGIPSGSLSSIYKYQNYND